MASNGTSAAVGKRVAALREARGMTVPELAKKAKVHRSHMWRIEDGQTSPPLARLERIARALGVGLPDLLAKPSQRPE